MELISSLEFSVSVVVVRLFVFVFCIV